MKFRKAVKLIILSLIILMSGGYFVYTFNMRNPFPDVQWIEDYPGATDRYVTFTPVLKSDNSVRLGPTVGADFGELRFKDLNRDGVKEAIIETQIFFNWGEYRSPERHILQYRRRETGLPEFILIKSEQLPE